MARRAPESGCHWLRATAAHNAAKTTRERPAERQRGTDGSPLPGRRWSARPTKPARFGPVIGCMRSRTPTSLKLGGTATAVAPIRGGGVFVYRGRAHAKDAKIAKAQRRTRSQAFLPWRSLLPWRPWRELFLYKQKRRRPVLGRRRSRFHPTSRTLASSISYSR